MALPASAAGENRTAYGKGRNTILQNIGADDYSVLHQDLNDIAERTIMISTETQSSGAVVTTYSNLDVFVDTVKKLMPELDSYELAQFLIVYIGQSADDYPKEEALRLLTYDNISTSIAYLAVNGLNGASHEIAEEDLLSPLSSVWTSPDGYMQLTTNFYKKPADAGTEKCFDVWTVASWIKYPTSYIKDVLVLGTTATFDDSVSEYGIVGQTFTCSKCQKNTFCDRSVEHGQPVDDDLCIKYDNFMPYIEYTPISPRCNYCNGKAEGTYFKSMIRYGVIVNDSANIQAAYGHTTFGFSGFSVSISNSGLPEITANFGTTVQTYTARAVTLK